MKRTINISSSYIPTTEGSRSTITARGTCFPAPVSLKNVLKESSPPPIVLSLGIWPSGWIPCSRQYSSQQALPIWTPACPIWTEIHSLWKQKIKGGEFSLRAFVHMGVMFRFLAIWRKLDENLAIFIGKSWSSLALLKCTKSEFYIPGIELQLWIRERNILSHTFVFQCSKRENSILA